MIRIFHSYPNWILSGVATWSCRMIRLLDPAEFDQRILITGSAYPDPEDSIVPPAELPLEILPIAPGSSRSAQWRALAAFLESQAPCLYLPLFDFDRAAAVGLLSQRIGVIGGLRSDAPDYYESARRIGHNWDWAVAVAPAIADQAALEAPALAGRIVTIPNGVDIPPSLDRPQAGPLQILYTGRIDNSQKRCSEWILIAAALRRLGVSFHLSIAGDGPDRAALEAGFATAGLSDAVTFAGTVRAGELDRLYAQAHIFLLTSAWEGLSNSLLEAMAAGVVPALYPGSISPGGPVAPGTNALVADGADALASAIGTLAREPARLGAFSGAARASVAKDFSATTMANRYADLFRSTQAHAAAGTCRQRDGRIIPPPSLKLRHRIARRIRGILSSSR